MKRRLLKLNVNKNLKDMADKTITAEKVEAFLKQRGERVLGERIDMFLRTKMVPTIKEAVEKSVRKHAEEVMDGRLNIVMNELLIERAKELIEARKDLIIDRIEAVYGDVLDLVVSDRLDKLGTTMDKIWKKRVGRSMENRMEELLESRVQQVIETRLEMMIDTSIETRLDDKIERYVDLKVSRLNSEELDEDLKSETQRHVEARVECIVSKQIDQMVAERVAQAIGKRGDADLTKKVQAIVAQMKMPERRESLTPWRDINDSHPRSPSRTGTSIRALLKSEDGVSGLERELRQKEADSKPERKSMYRTASMQLADFKASQKMKNDVEQIYAIASTASVYSLAEDLGELRHSKVVESIDSFKIPGRPQSSRQSVVQSKESSKKLSLGAASAAKTNEREEGPGGISCICPPKRNETP